MKQWIGIIITVALIIIAPWGSSFWAGLSYSIIGSAVGTVVNGGNWKSFAIGIGISIAAAGIASGIGGHFGGGADAFSKWASEEIMGGFVAGALTGAIAGGISSAVYGTNVGRGMLEGMTGGAIGAAVSMATGSVIEKLKSCVRGTSATEEVLTPCVLSDKEAEFLSKRWEVQDEQGFIIGESLIWAYKNPSIPRQEMTYPDGNEGWSLVPYYQCCQQATDLVDYINTVLMPQYYEAKLLAGTTKGFWRALGRALALRDVNHGVIALVPTELGATYGAKTFIVDPYNNILGRNFRTWTVEEFTGRYPKNQISKKPWTNEELGLKN